MSENPFMRPWRIAAVTAFVLAAGTLLLAPAVAQQGDPQKRERSQGRTAARTTPTAAPAPSAATAAPTAPAQPQAFETVARQALIIDYQTGAVLFEKNADERMPPSSMSKIMTAYVVFKAIKEGKLSL